MSNKIDRETFLAELESILAGARTPVGGTAYTSLDRERIVGHVFAHFASDGELQPLDRAKYEGAKARLARAREASRPLFEVVGELPRERRARQRAAAERTARVREAIASDPPVGSALNPMDPSAPEPRERRRPVRDEIAERAARADRPRRGFEVTDYTGRAA